MNSTMVTIADEATQASYQMHVARYGEEGKPVVVCVHGLTRNSADFHYLAEALSRDFYVLCPDIPGRGKSPTLKETALYNNGFYAGLIAQWLKAEHINAVHFIGTSMGGIIGMLLAATKPKLIQSFVVNDIGSFISKEVMEFLCSYVGENTTSADYATLAAQVETNLAAFDLRDPAIREHFVKSSIVADAAGWKLAYDPAIRKPLCEAAPADVDLSELWAAVKCPVLLLRGEKSEFLSESVAEKMLEGRANAALKTIPRAGHAPNLSTPEQITLIRQWLQKQ